MIKDCLARQLKKKKNKEKFKSTAKSNLSMAEVISNYCW